MVLATKLEFPFLGSSIVQRTRLMEFLNAGMKRRLTLLIAPAGYGKTALLAEWLSLSSMTKLHAGFVALDTYDNEPQRFWSYVITAIQRVFPGMRFDTSCLNAEPSNAGFEPKHFDLLLNEITDIPKQGCLILDDYQAITNGLIHQQISYLIENLPSNLHMYISSRAMPPLAWFRQLAQGQIAQITEEELSFNLEEAEIFLSRVMDLEISLDQAAAFLKMTEGWIAGLRLVAQSFKSQRNFNSLYHSSKDHFSQILEQMADQIPMQVPMQEGAEISDFLLRTSILEKFSAPLCDAILDRHDSSEVIGRVERANLFIVPLDSRRQWFRYHTLFRESLRIQLERKHPDATKELHHRAYLWHKENGDTLEAVHHAIAGGEIKLAAQFVNSCVTIPLIEVDPTNPIQWIQYFSPELIKEYPRLATASAQASFARGQFSQAQEALKLVEQTLNGLGTAPAAGCEQDNLRWEVGAIRASFNCVGSDFRQGIQQVQEAFEHAPSEGVSRRLLSYMSHFLGYAYVLAGELESAARSFDQACQYSRDPQAVTGYVVSRCEFAQVRKDQGRLRDAERAYRDALDQAARFGQGDGMAFFAQSGLAEICLDRHDIEGADRLMRNGLNYFALIDTDTLLWFHGIATCTRIASYFLAKGDLNKARLYYAKAKQILKDCYQLSYVLFPEMVSLQVRIWLAAGDLRSAIQWMDKKNSYENTGQALSLAEEIEMGRVNLALDRPSAALAILSRIEASLQGSERKEWVVTCKMLKALALRGIGENAEAIKCINEVVCASEPEGRLRPLIEQGKPMGRLMHEYAETLASSGSRLEALRKEEYLRRFFAAMDENITTVSPSTGPGIVKVFRALEPLSNRELEVLKIVADGGSVKDVATKLGVSVNTAKTHVKNVYRKLDVHNRFEASERAERLN